ncbi:RagB/SusD family nutrient uptake outer membrane protein [Flagellimonas sp. HMM57]|uniref:RagB/SusD family nutrient uptake outer membrane protein n=1 Tax=unclassified Flagellimonas TaxID=2644544 RepID=UPI001969DD9F|nr:MULTISPECIES: RagB/SusD family nutrient uptake outer membrane protein [unclassified Flagellimonas]UII77220.1 RagB/SusD family nutrient uptake outer membrane protein [Flagellimonas sp. HMM57]
MKNIIIKITEMRTFLWSIIILSVLFGCDDFVEEVEVVNPTAEESGETFEPVQFVTGVYGRHTDFSYAFSFLGLTEIISDNADKGSAPTDTGADKDQLDGLTHTTSSVSIRAMWTTWYKTIGRAALAIEFAEEFEDPIDEGLRARLIAECKFLRALNYFWLVRSFGDVPLQHIDLIDRVPVSEVYAYIEQDLNEAMADLPLKSEYAPQDLGRATRGAAQTLLSKVYLYQEKWQGAADMANTVINSGEYDLEPDYATVWRATTENGIESIFELQGRGEIIAHGIQQYSSTQGARGPDGFGWGFNTPSEDLLNAFNDEGDDIRRDATIIFAGETLFDGRVINPGVENPRYNEKAYSSANAGQADGDKNIRILRFAEILLIRAEALNELGQSSDALGPLNQVRNRVSLPNVNTTDQSTLRLAIWKERRLELAMEHDRWYDLLRQGRAAEVMTAHGKPFEVGKHELYPIPNDQLIQTPEMTQNPGW